MPTPVTRNLKNVKPKLEEKKERLPKKRERTVKQLNTIRIIHEKVAWYDILLEKYNSEPTPENKMVLEDYATHLRNVSQLEEYVYDYVKNMENTLLAKSKIRKVITEELQEGTLIKFEGLIRNPKTNPYENVPSTGNVIPIILPQQYINDLKSYLAKELVNESVRILVPCNNMILIAETGQYTDDINHDLNRKIFEKVMLFASESGMDLPIAYNTTVPKYILKSMY